MRDKGAGGQAAPFTATQAARPYLSKGACRQCQKASDEKHIEWKLLLANCTVAVSKTGTCLLGLR